MMYEAKAFQKLCLSYSKQSQGMEPQGQGLEPQGQSQRLNLRGDWRDSPTVAKDTYFCTVLVCSTIALYKSTFYFPLL